MVTFVSQSLQVSVPSNVVDLASFRRWAASPEFPEHGCVCFLDGETWVDTTMEDLISHVKVKAQSTHLLYGIADAGRLGEFFGEGAHIVNEEANLSAIPDACFATVASFERGRVQMVRGAGGKFIELIGILDMVLEIVSDSSVGKDTVRLKDLYARAGIAEYWIIDVRGGRMQFDLLRLRGGRYRAVRPKDGWRPSDVFGKSFRLVQGVSPAGFPEFRLEAR